MKINFEDIIDKHKGKTAIAFGLGPSSRPHVKMYERLSRDKDNFVFISCNAHHLMINTETDYWVVCNPSDTIKARYKWFNTKPDCTLVYADSIDLTDKSVVKKVLKCDYLAFDQTHKNGKACPRCAVPGCKFFNKNRLTIQEELKKYTKSKISSYSFGQTVMLHATAFAVLLGCNPIYVAGVDLDYTDPYLVNLSPRNPNRKLLVGPAPSPCRDSIIKDFETIYKMSQNIGVEMYTTVKNGYLNKSLPFKMIEENNETNI